MKQYRPNVLSPIKRRLNEAKGLEAGLRVLAYVIARAYTRDTKLAQSRGGAEVIYPQAEKGDPKENCLGGAMKEKRSGGKGVNREYAKEES